MQKSSNKTFILTSECFNFFILVMWDFLFENIFIFILISIFLYEFNKKADKPWNKIGKL